jgi:hypothetical protein
MHITTFKDILNIKVKYFIPKKLDSVDNNYRIGRREVVIESCGENI